MRFSARVKRSLKRFLKKVSPHLFLINDLRDIYPSEVFHHIKTTTNFSLSFVILLVASSIVVTLGLLLNSTAVVIGGMIISPLMWPLIKVAGGITYGTRAYVFQAFFMLVLAVAITLLGSAVITIVSPIKLVNPEIVARTNPTLLDVFIAFAAGSIAALAMAKKKISDSLAGVAIATSLMPPLCVSGIGLALSNRATFTGGFLLFSSNVVSIIFISIVTFMALGAKSDGHSKVRRYGLVFIAVMLLVTSIPLFVFLKKYSFQAASYQKVQTVLNEGFRDILPSLEIENIRVSTESKDSQNTVFITADILMPEDTTIDYTQKQKIVDSLESSLGRPVELRLLLQRTIAVEQKVDKENQKFKEDLVNLIVDQMHSLNESLTLDALSLNKSEKTNDWTAQIVFRGDPSVQITTQQQKDLEKKTADSLKRNVHLDIEIIPRIKIKSEPDVLADQIKRDIQDYLNSVTPEIDITKISLASSKTSTLTPTPSEKEAPPEEMTATLDILTPKNYRLDEEVFSELKFRLSSKYKLDFKIILNILEKESLTI